MTNRYASPEAFKSAIEQRLRNLAARDGRDLTRLRQLLVFDRFLARVFQQFGDAMVLKGGLALEMRLRRARTTRDVDLRVASSTHLLQLLQAAGRLELDDFLMFLIEPDAHYPDIEAEGLLYGGRRFRAEARLAGKLYGQAFHVDVAIAEPFTGNPDRLSGQDWLGFVGQAPTEFLVYPRLTHLAEKLHAYSLPRTRPNSRVRDLPDIALLAGIGPLDAGELRHAFADTFARRATHPLPTHIEDPPETWGSVYERIATVDELRWRTMADLLEAVRSLLNPVLQGQAGSWDPALWAWRS
ncbi:MAG: nucleotidyl transferase AbiEii/AbiGii toxin family protein [Planctomycetota bacterium]